MTGRTAGLIYTSADAEGANGGGFKITSWQGDLTEDELAGLASYRPSAAGLEDEALPQFATPEEVAAGPRALDYRVVLDGAAWWNVAPAGSDATGRGSNQVMHVAFTSEPSSHRPVERWRSPDWSTPFGRDEVAAATLPTSNLPQPQLGLCRDAVLDGLAGARAGDLEMLLVLLDVVVDALERELSPVLLVVDDADDAAWWLAAVTHLLPLSSARRVTFSILVDGGAGAPALAETLRRDGVLVGCISRSSIDLAGLPEGVAVVDTAGPVLLGLDGEPHHVAGRSLVAGEMSVLALDLLVEPELAAAAMAWVDAALEPDVDARWALAAALLRDPDRHEDAVEGAGRVVVARAPVVIPPELAAVTDQALESHLAGASAEETWKAYAAFGPYNAFRAAAAQEYVRRALADAAWLAQPLPLPCPTEQMPALATLDTEAVIDTLKGRAGTDDGSQRALLNAVALLTQVGAVDPVAPTTRADHAAREALASVVTPLVGTYASESAWVLPTSWPLPPVLRPALADLAVEVLEGEHAMRHRPVGQRFDPRLTTWLIPEVRDVLGSHAPTTLLTAEALVLAADHFPAGSSELHRAFEAAVVDREAEGEPSPLLERFGQLTPEQAASVLSAHRERRFLWLSERQLIGFLLGAPWGPAVQRLCTESATSMLTTVRSAAELRLLSRSAPWSADETGESLSSMVEAVLRDAPEVASTPDDAVTGLLQVVHVRAEISEPGSSSYLGTFPATRRVLGGKAGDDVQTALLAACSPSALLIAYLRSSWSMTRAPRVPIVVGNDGEQRELLEALARRALSGRINLVTLTSDVLKAFPPSYAGAIQETLLRLTPRGAKIAQSGQKLVGGVRNLLGRPRPDLDEEK